MCIFSQNKATGDTSRYQMNYVLTKHSKTNLHFSVSLLIKNAHENSDECSVF